ncbi:hypothetical protein PSMK_00770 [Phycisphaera mikurensis NBRC 102666]|uniref:Uncharacterized protein n=1 Tax=Phycisphaera mikurensis (strain NBRC 102666 / KCTC 22515 / FYK2301M01) TaxID=1142394 RepID=I0IAE8_PHYMF|nr:hypothetical protein PSMK_00770 [Phycisphaera mikurensis NBRC 102666]
MGDRRVVACLRRGHRVRAGAVAGRVCGRNCRSVSGLVRSLDESLTTGGDWS